MATTDNFDVQSDDITMSYSNRFQLSVTSGTAMRAGDISLSEASAQIYTEPGVLRLSTGAATFAMTARGPLSVLQTKADVYEQVADEWSLKSGGDIDITSNGTLSMQSVSGDLTFDGLQVETDTFAIESVDILVDSNETLEMVVGNATTLTSPFVSQYSDVTLVESSESITWRTGNASLSADAVAIDSSETLEMVVGNATTLTSPFVSQYSDVTLVESSESITWRASNANLSSTILDIRNQNTTIMAYNEIEIVSPSIDMVGVVTLGNETTTGQLVILNGVRSDLMETITADGTTGELSSGTCHVIPMLYMGEYCDAISVVESDEKVVSHAQHFKRCLSQHGYRRSGGHAPASRDGCEREYHSEQSRVGI